MKKTIKGLFIAAMLIAASIQIHAQGLTYDQQSATTPTPLQGSDGFNIQADSPLMQSFIPSLSAIGFVQFQFFDLQNNGTNGATVYVNLWIGSPNTSSATLLGSTMSVYMPNGWELLPVYNFGVTNFYFLNPITLTTGQTYYLQPVVASGDNPWAIVVSSNTYSGGDLFAKGTDTGVDLWFREGIVVPVPEPAILALVVLACGLVYRFKWHFKQLIVAAFAASVLSAHAADSVVQATAENAGLSQVITLPQLGTYWVITTTDNGRLIEMPYPFLPFDLISKPTYQVADSIFIVDDTGGQLSARRMSSLQAAATVQKQSQEVSSLITSIEFPTNSGGTDGVFQPNYTPMVYTTNDLWLSIEGVSNGISYLTIHPPWNIDVNDTNYNLFYTTNLLTPFTNWWWILSTTNGQTNLVTANAIDVGGFYALGYADTNGRPVVFGDFPQTYQDTPVQINIYPANYSSYTILTYPINGKLTGIAPNNLYYMPNPCYVGIDSFNYKINDGTNDSAPATVNITIIPNTVYAYEATAQTCRGESAFFQISGYQYGSGELHWALLTTPQDGYLNISNGDLNADDYYITNVTYTPNGTNFTGQDIFDYVVFDDCGNASTNTVTITVGDIYLNANSMSILTGPDEPVSITLSASDTSDSCNSDTNYYTYTLISSPTNGILSGTPPNLTYTPTNGQNMDSFQFIANDGAWTSSVPATVTIFAAFGPTNLTAQCRSNSIVLFWNLPDWIAQSSELDGTLYGFNIYRATNSAGPFILTDTVSNGDRWLFEDSSISNGVTYYYKVSYLESDGLHTTESPLSNVASSGTCANPPYLGAIDVAFIVDDTVSIWDIDRGAIVNGIEESLDSISAASGGDFRVALVTPDNDTVNVRLGLTNDITQFINDLDINDGYGYDAYWESTDECLNTIANALTQTNRLSPTNCSPAFIPLQTNNFPNFRTNTVKFVVLITDAPPGSFCESLDLARVHQYAVDAAANHIQINAIHVYHQTQDYQLGIIQQVMVDYADTSCGWYSHLSSSPGDEDIKNAVVNMLYTHGACY